MAWTDTYNGFNSTTRNLYDRYSGYRNGNAWSQVSTGNRGEYQWKAGSGSGAFYLSPQEYNQYDGWYRQEQDFKRQQQEQQRQQELQRQQEAQRQQELQRQQEAQRQQDLLRQQQEAQRQQELQRQQQEVLRQQQWQQEQQRQQEEQRRAAASFTPPPPLAILPTAPTAPTAPVFTPSTAPVTNPAPSQYTPSPRLSELDKVSLDSFNPKDSEEAAYVLQKHLASLSQTTKGLYDTYAKGLISQWPWEKRVEGGKTYYTTGYGYDREVLSEADFLNFQKLDKTVQDRYSAALPAAQKKDEGVISSAGAVLEPYSVQKSISGLLSGTEKSASILNQEYANALDAYRRSRQSEAFSLAEAQASRDRQQTLAEYEAATTKRRRQETDLANQLAQDRLNRRAVIEKRKLQGGLARASSIGKRLSGSSFFGSVS